jgi:hypothetical protein
MVVVFALQGSVASLAGAEDAGSLVLLAAGAGVAAPRFRYSPQGSVLKRR